MKIYISAAAGVCVCELHLLYTTWAAVLAQLVSYHSVCFACAVGKYTYRVYNELKLKLI